MRFSISKILLILRAPWLFRALLAVLACALVAAGLATAGWFWREDRFARQWQEHQAGLEAFGIPVRPADLLPPPPPPESNAAAILESAVELHKSLSATADKEAFSISGTSLKEKSADAAWRMEMLTVWQTAEALRLADLVGEAVRQPAFHVERDWNNPMAMSLEPNVSLLKISQWLAMRAAVFAREGRPGDSLSCIDSMFRLADFCLKEPLLISFLVGISIEGLASGSLEVFLQCPAAQNVDASRYKRLADSLLVREERVFPSAVRALDGERIFFADFIFANLRGGDQSLPALLRMVGGVVDPEQSPADSPWLSISAWAYQYPLRFFMDADQLAMADFHKKTRARFSHPLDAESVFLDYQRGDLVDEIPKHAILTRLSVPALDGVFDIAKVQVERLRLARLALTVFQFRQSEGRMPETPGELLKFDPQAPVADRFTGRPFVWENSDDKLELQSNAFNWSDEKLNKNRRRSLRWEL